LALNKGLKRNLIGDISHVKAPISCPFAGRKALFFIKVLPIKSKIAIMDILMDKVLE
jgi:hypothetical protein